MEINVDDIIKKMMDAAEDAFEDGWDLVKNYAPGEFKKMAVNLADIAQNVAQFELDNSQGYPPKTGKVLFKMQVDSCIAVLVAVTQLTIITVQKAINAILQVIKETFTGIIEAII
jgi:hypothetical protein